MRINPFYDAWLFLSGNTDEHRASGVAGYWSHQCAAVSTVELSL